MRVVKIGKDRFTKPRELYRFTCIFCKSVLEVELGELEHIGQVNRGDVYRYSCPVCKTSRLLDGDLLFKVAEEA